MKYLQSRALRIGLVVFVVAAIAATAAVRLRNTPQPPPVQTANVPRVLEFSTDDLARVQLESVARSFSVTGTLTPLEQAVLKTRAPGVLTEVLAREGEPVRKGQLLARVDATEVKAQLAAREADTVAARAQLEWAQRNLKRQGDLLDKGFISPNAYDSVKNDAAVARARLDAANAQAAQVRKSVSDQTLSAPLSGIVARRHAEPGERLPADSPILTIVSLDRLELAADVPTTEIARVALGQAVRVRVDGFGERMFEGRIERINPQATAGAGVVPVYVSVDNARHELRAGLFAHGQIVVGVAQELLTIPAAGVRERDGGHFVYVVQGDRLVQRAVTLSFIADESAVIASGLSNGDTVVAVNLGSLPENAAVRLPTTAVSGTPLSADKR